MAYNFNIYKKVKLYLDDSKAIKPITQFLKSSLQFSSYFRYPVRLVLCQHLILYNFFLRKISNNNNNNNIVLFLLILYLIYTLYNN